MRVSALQEIIRARWPDDLAALSGASEYRIRPVAPVARWAREHMSAYGVVRVAEWTWFDRVGVPVFVGVVPSFEERRFTFGYHPDAEVAELAAIMEAVEVWCATHPDVTLRWTTAARLAQDAAVLDLDRVEHWPGSGRRPTPLDPMPWVEGIDLISGQTCWVPFHVASMAGRTGRGLNYFPFTSIGLAAGSHAIEAIFHGLLEVIERDSHMSWMRSPRACPVDLRGVGEGVCRDLLRRLAAADVDLVVWDQTGDTGIPSYGCLVGDRPPAGAPWLPPEPTPAFGLGAALDPVAAITRALCEAIGQRALDRGRVPGLSTRAMDRAAREPERAAPLERIAHLRAEPSVQLRPPAPAHGLLAGLAHALDSVAAAGFSQVVAVDMGHRTDDVAVWRVVVPGTNTSPLYTTAAGPRAGRGRR